MPSSRATSRGATADAPDFPAWLAGLSDDALVRVCELRPDVATPPPASLDVLASRLRLPASTARAVGTLSWPELLVAAAAAAVGADSGAVRLGAVSGRLGVDDDEPVFHAAVARLRELALIWGEEDSARMVPVTAVAIRSAPVVAPHPGEPAGADLEAAWGGLSSAAAGVLEAIARGRIPAGALGAGASESVRAAAVELAQAGLAELTGDDDDERVVPRAHALDRARHGARADGSSLLHPPAWATPRVGAGAGRAREVDASGGVAALDLLHRCDSVLAALSTAPAATLKAGGVGVRELRRVARAAALEESELPLLLEVLAAAGLIAVGDAEVGDVDYDSVWAPTEAADVWSAREPARRWAELVVAWWSMPRTPWRVGSELEGGGTLPALGEPVGPPGPTERGRVLKALAALDPAAEPADALLPEVVRWSAPVWFSRAGARPVSETVAEARRMGLVVGTVATSAARHLVDATHGASHGAGGSGAGGSGAGVSGGSGGAVVEDLEPILTAALPDPVSEVIVQADLTILAPGPLTPELAAEFALLADVESAGAATTYRVTETSLRRALDAGRTAAGIREMLARTSVTPVPQSLDYLIEDVARRHGRLRVGTALSFIRCDDPSLVAQVLGSPVAESAALRSVAPTVLVSQARPLDLVEALRAHGFAPVVEDTSGAVVALSRPAARVRESRTTRAPRVPTRAPTTSELRAAVAAMRSADRVRSARGASSGAYTGEAAIARLHEAAGTGTAVTVSVVDAAGRSSARLVVPASVGGGRIEGIEPDSAEPVVLPLHRVISVSDVEPTR
ncbi:helicase-associated domain-containing protein [Dietzia cinnamea]|uniref:helicase-associated domain-containing protein n=1 Tax=Dietzia cinnamea TaxID=321318 RepID=UPI00195E6137|nr:helicase-associated domain-containing protein [Dietzia cinnamea]MBM7230412.1 helicase-associated domain-containing protein [Dietzia cinnamea]MCT1885485.1 helicase-associated domain-containing protein [Dietzia cinnamea]